MLRLLANTYLYRRLGRAIPNPILRSLAIAGVGYAARRLTTRRPALAGTGRAPGRGPRVAAPGSLGGSLGAR